ncbi:protein translocase subunit SecD [Clostridium vincentii]|uniref:Multifunctional fusion protein n=1 Tax=Clostridium vincentii TaxID=52704 RepID=A0A2T0BBK8_9CLOT|nr:protein translocase subunit SecD [Clostridium vincentii]PRR81222.1 bifunctional preprotein translocase subunit SecD/SecF [Clostridium vincentii]
MKKKRKSAVVFIICVIAIFTTAYLGFSDAVIGGFRIKSFDQAITKGLDLQGGVSVTMEIQDKDITKEDLDKTKKQLELRVNKIGVSETVVTTEGDKRIRVDIPGQFDSASIVESLSKTGTLTFKSPDGEILLTGADIEKASVISNSETGVSEVSLEMNTEGQPKFADATAKYLGQKISIYMDDEVLSSPTVNSVITEGNAKISGSTSIEEAKTLVGLINAGALPVTVKAVSVQTVGAQLGATAMPSAVKAGALGIGLIFLFMILFYKIPGLISSIALTLYITLTLFVFGEVGATLTLPGIAAFLLTIGMAVDANVLIFERTREELAKGVSIKSAVKKGFEEALSSIVDSNVTTIIAALVLYFFGTGAVKGFAVTLMIGILVSLFTALVITKFLIYQAVEIGLLSKLSHFRAKKTIGNTKVFKLMEKTKIWFVMSSIVIIIGIGFMIFRGFNVGIDFNGGTQVVIQLNEDFNKEEVDTIAEKYTDDFVSNTVEGSQYQIKSGSLDSQNVSDLVNELKSTYELGETPLVSQNEIGASIGNDLKRNSIISLGVAFIAMLIYIAIRFEMKFGIAALIAIFHDILLTLSFYAIFNIQVNTPFIAAILTIIGYSINDTIVIFDRIRENSKTMRRKSETEIANVSVTQTMTRSINTTLTTLVTIVAVNIFVPAVREFATPLIIGIAAGAYSSIFIASPFWVILKKKKKHKVIEVK